MFKKYEKIHAITKEECDGILQGKCYIQEKIDGANTSIWIEGDRIHTASRNQEVSEGFNGFVEYVEAHEGIKRLLTDHPEYHLFGEWLVKHTIDYKATAYKKFYMFDILADGEFLEIPDVYAISGEYGIEMPHLFGVFEDPTMEDLQKYVGLSMIGEKGEGIVIKNFGFINKFFRCDYAKLVSGKFKEDNGIVFGGNHKGADNYWEMYIVNKYITLARVQKVMNKMEPHLEERFDMKHVPRVMATVYHDMITEEIWEIQKKVPMVDFKRLSNLCQRKAKQIYVDIINDTVSVADQNDQNNQETVQEERYIISQE